MNTKKLLGIGCVLFSSFSLFAFTPEEIKEQEQENMKILSQMGLPLPGSGIKLVSRDNLNLSQEELEKGQKEQEEFKSNGYIEKYDNRPLELINFHKIVKKQLKLSKNDSNPESTGLKSTAKEIQLAFDYDGIYKNKSLSGELTILAATPQGGYHKDKGGWSGVAEFFESKDIGSCSYGVMNVKASNTAVNLAIEDVVYFVNEKPTLINVEGSDNSGFVYQVKWYDHDNFHELECANMKYSPELSQKVIQLAVSIDKNT